MSQIIGSLNGLFVGLLLAINDVFSFGITKNVYLKKYQSHWLIIP